MSGGWSDGGTNFIPHGMKLVANYSKQILLGLSYIHNQGVVHADIKSENIMMCGTQYPMWLKIADIDNPIVRNSGITEFITTENLKITLRYSSPELQENFL